MHRTLIAIENDGRFVAQLIKEAKAGEHPVFRLAKAERKLIELRAEWHEALAAQLRADAASIVVPPEDETPGLLVTMKDPFAEPVELREGMYRGRNGAPVRVYRAKAGHLLAQEVVGTEDGGYEFNYLGAAVRFVDPRNRMTLDEAKAFGRQTGYCGICSRELTDPTSVAAGIGPICSGKV